MPFQGLIQGTGLDGVAISTLLYTGYYGKMSIIACQPPLMVQYG